MIEEKGANSISKILKNRLDERKPVTNKDYEVQDLFDGSKAAGWMGNLLDGDGHSGLKKRVAKARPERLTHAASAYLLGLAVREGLDLNFDVLPRIFSHGAIGDSFHFFWSAICLCHDLGYQYEWDGCKLSLMDSPEGRRTLLEIQWDLFELDDADLADLGIEPGEERDWVVSTLDLAKKYDRLRRKCEEKDSSGAVVDHGIAGALILYDILMDEYERFRPKEEPSRSRDPSKPFEILEGEMPAHAGHKRFAACAVIIACTVARHNMWTARECDTPYYQRYGLSALCKGGSAAKIRGNSPLDQLLFLLCFMDTIDPVKGIYIRGIENFSLDPAAQKRIQEALLDDVSIRFQAAMRHRWQTALKYRALTISLSPNAPEDIKEIFSRYAEKEVMLGMRGWLQTKQPALLREDGRVTGVTCYYPSFPRRERIWKGGIFEHEITALCLYAGGGVGNAGFFYQCRNAYQTFNLLMMEGFEGEEVRVLQEGQKPYGHYILEWQHTLEVMTDILTAQYKFMEYDRKNGPVKYTLRRVDRRVNFDMMCRRNETFAFTSTSKAGYLQGLARPKKDLVLLEVKLTCPVPFVDYERLLERAYVYSDEQEVLLPPFLEVLGVREKPLSPRERTLFPDREQVIPRYEVTLGGFFSKELRTAETDGTGPRGKETDELELIEWLEANKQAAADVLDQLRGKVPPSEDEKRVYLNWKARFQQLTRSCFANIGKIFSQPPEIY